MKTLFNRLADLLRPYLGLDFDFSIKMRGDAFNQINNDLYVGARPGPDAIPSLKQAGITHIISCLREEDRADMAFLQQDFRTLFLAVHDGIHQDIAMTFPDCFAFTAEAQESQPEARLLIHCQAGVSRSATLAIAYLMQSAGQNFYDTFVTVRAQRPGVLPNIGFASQLQRLEHELHPDVTPPGKPSSLARYLHQFCNVPVAINVLQAALERHDYDAPAAIEAIFGDIPRVVQGVRL